MVAAAERLGPDVGRPEEDGVGYLAPVPSHGRRGGDDTLISLCRERKYTVAYLPCSSRMQSDAKKKPTVMGQNRWAVECESLLIGLTKVWFLKMGQSVGQGRTTDPRYSGRTYQGHASTGEAATHCPGALVVVAAAAAPGARDSSSASVVITCHFH
jgi:hypothetical protein